MNYRISLMILCFVGLMQSKNIYLSNDLGEPVGVRCFQGSSEVSLPAPRKHECTIDGKKVTYNILQSGLYLASLDDEKGTELKVQMIKLKADATASNVLEKTIEVSGVVSALKGYIKLSDYFGRVKSNL